MTAPGWWTLVAAVLLVATGCSRGADAQQVETDLQARLDRDLKHGLLEVVAVQREGSAPMPADASGAERVVVYYNATLRLAHDYAFGGWEQLPPSSLAYALGATEQGLLGVNSQNHAGDLIRAYGSTIYEQGADGWTPLAGAPAQTATVPDLEGTGPSSRSRQLIDKLASMVNLPPPGVPAQQDEIIADELARASENIERRVQRREQVFTLATGPEGSEYSRFGRSLIAAINEASPRVKLRQRASQGSVENALLLARGEADYAVVQADVAAAAMSGGDMFAHSAPLENLRAVGGLFPEAIHVVVLPDSPIREIAQLRGRRVDLGEPSSGTHFDAVAVLAAHGMNPADLGESRENGPNTALAQLRRKQVDAVFMTTAAPARALQQLGAEVGFRLLPISGAALERLVQARPGLTPLTLPANTYPRQKDPCLTGAAVALLLTTADAPGAEVERLADLVFGRMPGTAGGGDVVRVSSDYELRGVTIPLHPGAGRRPR